MNLEERIEWRRFLLAETLLAYSDMDEAEWEKFEALLATEKYRDARAMTQRHFERGELEGQRQTALMQLESKFGP